MTYSVEQPSTPATHKPVEQSSTPAPPALPVQEERDSHDLIPRGDSVPSTKRDSHELSPPKRVPTSDDGVGAPPSTPRKDEVVEQGEEVVLDSSEKSPVVKEVVKHVEDNGSSTEEDTAMKDVEHKAPTVAKKTGVASVAQVVRQGGLTEDEDKIEEQEDKVEEQESVKVTIGDPLTSI